MSNQEKPMAQKLYENAPTTRQTVKFVTAAGIGLTLLFLSGITLTGTVLSVILATPILILFSPILVPAGIALFLATAGLLFSGGCGVAAVTALSWIYNYLAGKHPIGSDKVDYARERIADKARDMKDRAKAGYGQYAAQDKGSEVAA